MEEHKIMEEEIDLKRPLVRFTRDLHIDQVNKMKSIQNKTGVNIATQLREILDQHLKLGAYSEK